MKLLFNLDDKQNTKNTSPERINKSRGNAIPVYAERISNKTNSNPNDQSMSRSSFVVQGLGAHICDEKPPVISSFVPAIAYMRRNHFPMPASAGMSFVVLIVK